MTTKEDFQEQDLASFASMTTADLVTDVMGKIDRLVAARKTVTRLAKEAREVQAELSDRGVNMQFDALDIAVKKAIISNPEIPSPGLTEAIPEEFDDVSQISIREPLDNRSVADIRKEANVPAAQAEGDSQNFQQSNAKSMQDAIKKMMGITY